MKKIGVIFGGVSSEYEVSLSSATSVLKAMESLDYEIYMLGITRKGNWLWYQGELDKIREDKWLQEDCRAICPSTGQKGLWVEDEQRWLKVDVLFPVLHGGYGEDGSMQGLFEMMEIPYVGCGVAASALCMNKWLLHQFAENVGIKSTPTICITAHESNKAIVQQFIQENGYPIFVKPNEAGSSKGITRVTEEAELAKALTEAFFYCHDVILQKGVQGIEIGCGILGNDELIVGECDQINLETGFFDYVEKYQMVTAKIILPAEIPMAVSEQIKEKAELLYRSLGCRGLSRIDFFLTDDGEILLNEVNTMPGFTAHSRFPAMLAAVGYDYPTVIDKLIKLTEESL